MPRACLFDCHDWNTPPLRRFCCCHDLFNYFEILHPTYPPITNPLIKHSILCLSKSIKYNPIIAATANTMSYIFIFSTSCDIIQVVEGLRPPTRCPSYRFRLRRFRFEGFCFVAFTAHIWTITLITIVISHCQSCFSIILTSFLYLLYIFSYVLSSIFMFLLKKSTFRWISFFICCQYVSFFSVFEILSQSLLLPLLLFF